MSSSDDAPRIHLLDDQDAGSENIRTTPTLVDGRVSTNMGRNPGRRCPVSLLVPFLEESDERLEQLAEEYREGSLWSDEPKEVAAERRVLPQSPPNKRHRYARCKLVAHPINHDIRLL